MKSSKKSEKNLLINLSMDEKHERTTMRISHWAVNG